jgi:hypothetical protein
MVLGIELERCRRKWAWLNFKILSQHLPGGTEAEHENLSQGSLRPRRHSNWASPRYKSLESTCLILCWYEQREVMWNCVRWAGYVKTGPPYMMFIPWPTVNVRWALLSDSQWMWVEFSHTNSQWMWAELCIGTDKHRRGSIYWGTNLWQANIL